LRSENFVAFFTICGFFLGLIFSMVKYDDALNFLIATLVITLFFYLFIHVVLTFFLASKEITDDYFDKSNFETFANAQIDEIKIREEKITTLLKSIHSVEENS
jgi:hypothetical protein